MPTPSSVPIPVAAPTGGLARRALRAGREAGLVAVGITGADPLDEARDQIEDRRRRHLHAGMGFTFRNPARSTDPRSSLPSARAVVAGALAYGAGPDAPAPPGSPAGRVARVARAEHYEALREALGAVAAELRAEGWRAVVVADQNHLVDRAVARRAGLGWFGKSSLLLVRGVGTWCVLGSVVTDAPLAPTAADDHLDGCGTCTACVVACPTGAIVAPGVVDGRRCLSWVVQAPGAIPRSLRAAMGDRLYGCDDCQEACPPGQVGLRRRSAPDTAPDQGAWVDLLDLLAADDATLLGRHGRWYLADRDPRGLRRNALVVLGNTADAGDPRVAAALARALAGPDGLLAAHAAWAARRLDRHDLLTPDVAARPEVAEELAAPEPPRQEARP